VSGHDTGGWFDDAQICRNGHLVNSQVRSAPYLNQPFCVLCGEPTMTHCPLCDTPIHGAFHEPGIFIVPDPTVPLYCLGCGAPYPWTSTRLEAAKGLADEMRSLKPSEREAMKRSIDDLVHEAPRSHAAALTFKRLLAQAGAEAASGMREVLINVVSESARRIIWGV
jgi:hypothetical protein